jgi:MYXO-CTERM domain-containing protein
MKAIVCRCPAATIFFLATTATAQTLVPGPGETGYDTTLAAKVGDYDRKIHQIMAVPLGFGLEAFVAGDANRATIDDFFASGAADFEAHTGKHVYEVLRAYGEQGDLGMFGGVQAAGDAFRYAVLRDAGAPTADVDRARQDLLRAMDGLHWFTQVTGEPGVVARGLDRITPEAGDPPLPGTPPNTVPLFDGSGDPQPADKTPTWREDRSGELPFLVWLDDTSKDQFDGYVFALGAVHDAVEGDTSIPKTKKDALVEDARAIGLKLMERVEVGGSRPADLVLVDADGRPTSFHDLSAEELTPGTVLGEPINPFNAVLALGAMRTLYHITGDERIGRFYYEELVSERGYLDLAESTWSVTYTGTNTNYSNINMGFVAIYGVLRHESEPGLAAQARRVLENQLYAPGKDREARGLKQSLFDFIYAGFRSGGTDDAGNTAVKDGLQTLREFPNQPYWNDAVINCDDGEIAAGSCTAVDGSTIELSDEEGWKGRLVAIDPVPRKIRPPDNYEWRSDPHRVNGGGGDRLNPGGGFWAAYWMGRLLEASDDGMDNISSYAREPVGYVAPELDGGVPDAGSEDAGDSGAGGTDGGADAAADAGPVDGGAATDAGGGEGSPESGVETEDANGNGGCGCRAAGGHATERTTAWAGVLLALFAVARRRRLRG